MTILLYGESGRYGSGAWCYYNTLLDLRLRVVSFSDEEQLAQAHRLWARGYAKVAHRLWEPYRLAHTRALLRLAEIEKPELVIVLKGLHISAADVLALRRLGARVVNINHDDFFSRNRNNWSATQRDAIPAYDFIFTTREVNVAEVRPLNPNVAFFPFAYYPKIHRPVPLTEADRAQFPGDVVFIGTWEAQRAQLLEAVVGRTPATFAIYGDQWNKLAAKSCLRPLVKPAIYGDDLCKALGAAKISLAFLRKENRDDYTQRTFEIPACGGLLLAERTPRHQQYYREGSDAEFFDASAPDELARKIVDLLSNEERRERIRASGMLAVRTQQHTYADRLVRLLEVLQNAVPGLSTP